MEPLCIVVADAGRARLFTYAPGADATPEAWTEASTLVDPERRLTQHEHRSDAPGRDRTPLRRGFGLDDHRAARTEEMGRRFAGAVLAEARALARRAGAHRLVVVAPPAMLGVLRPLAHPLTRQGLAIAELPRDLSRLPSAALRDQLADAGLVPARARA
jgi:protein required for attachment to host cells